MAYLTNKDLAEKTDAVYRDLTTGKYLVIKKEKDDTEQSLVVVNV